MVWKPGGLMAARTPRFRRTQLFAFAGIVVALVIALFINSHLVRMQTRGAQPHHYRLPIDSPTLDSPKTVVHDLAYDQHIVAVADLARGLSVYKHGSWRSP